MAHDVNRMIIIDDETLPRFIRASQNIAAVMALFHGLLEATTPEDHRAHRKIRTLLERAAHSRPRACCLGDASSTPANTCSSSDPVGTHRSTRHHRAAGSALLSWCISVSAVTATHVALSTPIDVPTAIREKEPAVAIILVAVDATIAARIGA